MAAALLSMPVIIRSDIFPSSLILRYFTWRIRCILQIIQNDSGDDIGDDDNNDDEDDDNDDDKDDDDDDSYLKSEEIRWEKA
jgi:hypothetical protein